MLATPTPTGCKRKATRLKVSEEPIGFLLIDKPEGPTSHDVIKQLRARLHTRKIGHAGTLDPAASGLLVCGVGRCTKALTYLVGADKHYLATITLGVGTTSDDAQGEVVCRQDASAITESAVDRQMTALSGEIMQVPTTVSAIKIDGKRAHARVRDGEEVSLAARPVVVHEFTRTSPLRHHPDGTATFQCHVHCSSGTYVRALARDLGAGLGIGAHLSALRRTQVGPLRIEQAGAVDSTALRAPIDILGAIFPTRALTEAQVRAISYGQFIDPNPSEGIWTGTHHGAAAALLENRGRKARPRWAVITK